MFWVHASNATRFEQSFGDIADKVKIPRWRDSQVSIYELVRSWLCDERKGKWLMILDNVDDASFLLEKPSTGQEAQASIQTKRPLKEYLPTTPNGSILITSRNRGAALKLVEQRDIIDMGPMDKADAIALCEKKLGIGGKGDTVGELVEALEFMPLAIVQAAAYIKEREPRCSVEQYLEKFQKSDKAKTSLLNHEAGELRRDWEAKNSIILTWQITFDHIREIRLSAAHLLSLMSFFDRQGIPEFLLLAGARQTDEGESQGIERDGSILGPTQPPDDDSNLSERSIEDVFENDIATLKNYSFVSVTKNPQVFEMHRLVQIATQRWLDIHGELEEWKRVYIRNLKIEAPDGEYGNWTKWRTLFPHVKAALLQPPNERDALLDWSHLLFYGGWYCNKIGNYSEAERMAVKSMNVSKILSDEQRVTDTCGILLLSDIYLDSGRFTQAEELVKQCRDLRLQLLGAEHPETLAFTARLLDAYIGQGQFKEAEELGLKLQEAQNRVLGAEHVEALITAHDIARIYYSQGRLKAAEELALPLIDTRKRVFGVDHPRTLSVMHLLGLIHLDQGRLKEAEELQSQLLDIQKRVLGMHHPDTLSTMDTLAVIYGEQGKREDAEKLHAVVLELRIRELGEVSHDVLYSLHNLAVTWGRQDRHEEAIALMKKCVRLGEGRVGPDDPRTIESRKFLMLWETEPSEDT